MKHLVFCLLSLCVAVFCNGQTVPCYLPTTGLVAWYPFTGNTNDSSGNGNNGVDSGAILTTDRFGHMNGAYYFNGASHITASLSNDYANMSMSVWYKKANMVTLPITSTDSMFNLVGFSNDVNGNTDNIGATNHGGWSSPVYMDYYAWDGSSPNWVNTMDAYCDTNWHHLTSVRTSTKIYLYKDGWIQDSVSWTGTFSLATDLIIGKLFKYWPGYYFNGKIDDIAIYSRALTPCEIYQLYSGSCSASAPIVTTITGSSSLAIGATITLTDATTGGTWNASNSHATISGGVVTGVSAGIDTISYTVTSTCGSATATLVVTVTPSTSIGLPCYVPASGLVAWYPFTGNAIDSSGNGNNGTVYGATLTADRFGNPNSAYSFNGSGQYIQVPNSSLLNPNVISFNFWFKPLANNGGIISKRNITTAYNFSYGVVHQKYYLAQNGLYTGWNNSGSCSSSLTSSEAWGQVDSIPNDVYSMITVTIDSSGLCNEYKNGILLYSYAGLPMNVCETSDLYIGLHWLGDPSWFNGIIDEIGIWDRVISPCEISQLYHASCTAVVAGTITGSPTVSTGSTITLTDATTGGTWSASNSHATISGEVVTGVSVGIDTISYTVTNTCGSAVASYIVTVTISGGGLPCYLPTSGLVGWYPFTGNANDSSGNGNNGTNNGATLTTDRFGNANSAYSFDGSSNYIVVPNAISLNPSEITINFWFKPYSDRGAIIDKVNLTDAGSFGYSVLHEFSWYSYDGLETAWNTNGDCSTPPSSYSEFWGTSHSVPNNVWSMITVTIDSSGLCNQYINGVLNSTFNGSPMSICNSINSKLYIGEHWSGDPAWFNGIIDEIGIWNRVIFPCEISQLYHASCTSLAGTITGTPNVCVGSTTTVTDTTTGGTWSATNSHVSVSLGVVTGISAGVDTIQYSVVNACGTSTAIKVITVNGVPMVGTIMGYPAVCVWATVLFHEDSTGGIWSSSDNAIATVNSSGVATGVSSGVVYLSYSITNSCGTGSGYSAPLTVNPLPASISGLTSICQYSTNTLSDAGSGTWSTSNSALAVVDPTSGIVNAYGSGIDTIIFTNSGGCHSQLSMTINPFPNASTITGSNVLCMGTPLTLIDTAGGGSGMWSSSNTAVANVSADGIVTGVSAGVVTINYMVVNGCGAAVTHKFITVGISANPGAITGSGALCLGTLVTLSDTSSGGVWSVTNGHAIVTGGIVSGVTTGIDTVFYSTGSGVCNTPAMHIMSIDSTVVGGVISGPSTLNAGTNITLSESSSGGTWSSSNGHATVVGSGLSVPPTALVSGISVGIDTISYTVTNACGTASTAKAITIYTCATSGAITGQPNVCVGATITLTDPVSGGTWTASNGRVAISSSGVVTGISAGTDTIIYSYSNICGTGSSSKIIIVNPLPMVSIITGSGSVCVGNSITLADSVSGGVWNSSSSSTTVASSLLTSPLGIVTGVANGYSSISYTVTNACGSVTASKSITINTLPNAGAITGSTNICPCGTTTLNDSIPGGTWSVVNAFATVIGSGVIGGIETGIDTVSYSVTNACGTSITTMQVIVNDPPVPGIISGASVLNAGTNITLSETVTGGVWSSTNSHATVSSTGVVSGVSAGVDSIIYTVSLTCGTSVAIKVITVNACVSTSAISGLGSVCTGNSITLSDTTAGGTWSATNPHAMVSSGGVVSGITEGVDTIVFSYSNSCISGGATQIITVSALPNAGAITGFANMCIATSITLSDSVAGGNWSSSTLATISSGGVLSAVSAGTNVVTYTVVNSCGSNSTTKIINIAPFPSAGIIYGADSVCTGAILVLSDSYSGGYWSATNGNANVTSGIVTGLSAGVDTLHYLVTNECGTGNATFVITVNGTPSISPISGLLSVCPGDNVTLSESTTGGTWSVSNGFASTTGSGTLSLVATGVSAGMDTISYSLSNLCGVSAAIVVVTINPLPSAGILIGADSLCIGTTTTLLPSSTGGSWSVSNSNATVLGGVVGAVSQGLDTVTYLVSNSCGSDFTSKIILVKPLPDAGTLTGSDSVCVGAGITLSDIISGGTWGRTNSLAGVASGVVSGVVAGRDTVLYSVANYCGIDTAWRAIRVLPQPNAGAITGSYTVCVGATITLHDSTAIGTGGWSSVNGRASVSGSGVVAGLIAGTDSIKYSATNSCGTNMTAVVITINPLPNAGIISGNDSVCVGGHITLTESVTGGAWSVANTHALVTGGLVTGHTSGLDVVKYTVTNTCGSTITTFAISVDTTVVPIITGASLICVGSHNDTLTATPAGGSWTASNGNATIVSGIATGVNAGLDTIIYSVSNACGVFEGRTRIKVFSVPECDSIMYQTQVAQSKPGVKIYPNPSTGVFTVEIQGINTGAAIQVFDVFGRKITETFTQTGETQKQLDLSAVSAGVYQVRILTDKGYFVGSVSVVH